MARIAQFIAEAAGATIAIEVVERLRSKCRLIAETPGEIGVHRPEIREGIRSFAVPPYVLFFRYREKVTEVARILHERQDLEQSFSQ